MRKSLNRVLVLVLLLALIGSSAMAATINSLIDTATSKGFKVSETALKKRTAYSLTYTANSGGADKLTWTNDKRAFTVSAKKAATKSSLKSLYWSFIGKYNWSAASYIDGKKVLLGYNVKSAKTSYKTLAKFKSAVKAKVSKKTDAKPDKQSGGQQYVLNTSTKKFHYPGCRDVSRMNDKNKQYTNSSRDSIIKDGYSPCGHCNP